MRQQGSRNRQNYDNREYLRKNCYLPIVEQERDKKLIGSILNLSTSGLFVETERVKDQNGRLRAKFFIPRVPAPINFLGEVVYIKREGQTSLCGMGIRFLELNNGHQKTLKNYILNNSFNEILKDFQRNSYSLVQNLKPFNDKEAIYLILSAAAVQRAPLKFFGCGSYTLIMTLLQDVGKHDLSLRLPEKRRLSSIKVYDHLYLVVSCQGTNYFFEATVKQIGNNFLIINMPDVIYFEERRVETRFTALGERGSIEFRMIEDDDNCVIQEVTDINSSGLSLNLPSGSSYFSPGKVIRNINVVKGKKVQKQESAKVVHVTPIKHDQLKVGLEFLVERKKYEFKQLDFKEDKEKRSILSTLTKTAKNLFSGTEDIVKRILNLQPKIHIVKYCNKKGEEIVAILNATFDLNKLRNKVAVPVVIIPPAFARRKETTSFLALTIIENFRRLGKDIVVIRYDGIRTVGESHNDKECLQDNKEMLNFTTSQAIDDLFTTIDYAAGEKSPVVPSEIIIVSFSNASVVARKVILKNTKYNITNWINVMGITDPQDLILNATCGIDYIYNYERGDTEGSFELLGHLVKKKILGDVIDNQLAYLEDARNDIARIKIPITWIYGKYDYWTNQKRVKEVMSVKSVGFRSVIEVPTGHIVRTGTEAMNVFALITEKIWYQLYSSIIKAVPPNRSRAMLTNNLEWARVKRKRIDLRAYWRDYLTGKQVDGLGFDVLSLTEEYQEMMKMQVDLLDLYDEDVIGDMGGGTGNLTRFIFHHIALRKERYDEKWKVPRIKIFQVDLVPDILEKSETKHEKIRKIYGLDDIPLELQYVEADLNVRKGNEQLPFPSAYFTKIIGSLLISYLSDPSSVICEFNRILKQGGTLVLSSLKRDADMSKAFHDLVGKVQHGAIVVEGLTTEAIISSVQEYVNSTAYLSDLEEEGLFRFYTSDELKHLLKQANFTDIKVYETGGTPPQILVVVGKSNK